jgi:hypothetical protein
MDPRFTEERWRTVRSALGNWSRTIRLRLIILIIGAPAPLRSVDDHALRYDQMWPSVIAAPSATRII